MTDKYNNMDEVFEKIFGVKPTKRGMGLEQLTGAVLKIINEARDVTHDVMKAGLYSTDTYQIDILVDGNNESIFVEAKDYRERNIKTGRSDAQKLAGALNNLNIDKGLLVSSTGFTAPTIKYSKSTKLNPNAKEINLCLIRPTNEKDTENLIFEIVVDASFEFMDNENSKSNILLNQESLKNAFDQLKNEGYKPGLYKMNINEFFDKNGNHFAYVHDVITTKLPREVKDAHKGVWYPPQDVFIRFKNKLVKIDGVQYEFVYTTNVIKNFVHIKEEPILVAKSKDLNLDYIITKRQLKGIKFEQNGLITYREHY